MKYLNKAIEYGLYVLVFLLPLGTRWIIKPGFTEYQTYSLYGTDILLIGLLLLFILNRVVSRAGWRVYDNKKEGLFIVLFLLAAGLSIFFALDKSLALYKFGWLVLGLGLFWLITRADLNREKLIWSFLSGLAVQAALGIWQFLMQMTFANKWLGLALHRASDLGVSVVETLGADGVGERWLRAYGGFDHPNIFGGAMAIGILFLIGRSVQDRKILKIIYWFFLSIFSTALFFSFSRAGWLALALGLIAALTLAVIKKDLVAQKKMLQTILISGSIFFILFFQYSNLVITRLYAGERLEVKSNNERIESIKNSWPIIKNNWAGGVGLGNYVVALKQDLPERQNYYYQPAHNVFVLTLSELGVVGLLFFVFLFLSLLMKGWKIENFYTYFSVLFSLFILLSLDHWLWSLHFGVLFFWLAIGLAKRESCG